MNYNTTSLILIHYNNIWFSCFDLSVTLDHKFPQNLHFFIFNNTFWSMLIPFLTLFQVVFPTQFPLNYFCNITVPSLVLLLCQLFTCAQNIIIISLFLSHILQIGLSYLSCVSHSLLELLVLAQHIT